MGLIDFDALLFGPVYTVLGETARLTVKDGFPQDLSAIDETAGVEVLDGPSISTIRPAATVRSSELAEKGIAVADLPGAALTLNGKDWTVVAHQYLPTPKGETQAEIRLILEENADGCA
ncbi:hypothetical protein [Mesorhizobium sp.]|uniref:hypothetical protein n=1 Tax=Mesorhizobium sp. TaxID=1871066 RepID=UPI001224756C|nr:hypothetical protein [Mesorhizobium sp.]TIL34316.1 MAG: hypothetical protein E5Y85_11285 [Mesorhizobium sp.]TIM09137.1 MAG: hypothetical protein E5Y62_13345 [Mesorhizobium sp.]